MTVGGESFVMCLKTRDFVIMSEVLVALEASVPQDSIDQCWRETPLFEYGDNALDLFFHSATVFLQPSNLLPIPMQSRFCL